MRLCLLFPPLAALLAGCLKEGRPVVGRFLVPGRTVEKPGFVKFGSAVTYEVRRRRAEPPYSGAYDFAIVSYDTGESRTLVENAADRWGREDNQAGLYFLMADEVTTATPGATAGTLTLVDLDQGVLDRIPSVSSFGPSYQSRDFFYRVATDDRLATLHYRAPDGTDRVLGLSSGTAEFRGTNPDKGDGSSRLYFIICTEPTGMACLTSEENKTLYRITRPAGAPERLRNKVSRFMINNDQSWVVITTPVDSTKTQVVAHPLDGGNEHVVPASASAYWMDFSGTVFTYSESATSSQPATLHTYNVVTEEHKVTRGPAGLVDIRDVRGRPGTTDRIYIDSRGQLAVVPDGQVDGKVIGGAPVQLSVTEDGKYALYIELVLAMPPQGRLMIQDLDFAEPPRVLSPRGGYVPVPGYFFINDIDRKILVFWAQFGQSGVDLYYADHQTGDQRVVAEAISEVVVTPHQVVGIVRVSEQDLTGDLVNKDLVLDKEIVLAHEVAEDAISGDRVVFVVRERVNSEQDGLWAIGIDGTPPDAPVIEKM